MSPSLPTSVLLAADAGGLLLPILASVLAGGALFVLARTILNVISAEPADGDEVWRYDVTRMAELRAISLLVRIFGPLIGWLARINRRAFRDQLPGIARDLHAAGLPRYWLPEEYLGRIELITSMLAPLYIWLGLKLAGPPGLVIGLAALPGTAWLLRRQLHNRAERRLFHIKQRLPFLLDLLTLLMEAGATFMQALEQSVGEFRDHPVGGEFGRVLSEINMGKARVAALESLRERLDDPEITSIVGSIVQGEILGTPLAQLFRTQADVLRIKRTQRAETVAGEAGVKMLLPSVVVMIATVMIILGPFLISFLFVDLF